MNLYTLLTDRPSSDNNRICIDIPGSHHYTWGDVERGTARLAHLLRNLGLPDGARVAVQVEKSAESLLLYLATLRAGYVYLPLNTAYKEAELDYFLRDAEPSVLVCRPQDITALTALAHACDCNHVFTLDALEQGENHGTLLEAARHLPTVFETVTRDENDLAAILYTSGTTGRSKGAMLSHGNLASNARVLHEAWRWQAEDVLLHTLPLFHVHGLFVACHGALLAGATMIFLPKFDAAAVMRELPRTTVFMGVPTYYVRLLQETAFDQSFCNNMRLFVSGSAPMLLDTFDTFRQRTGHTILERYGMSETTMLTSNPYDGERRGGTVGFPLPGVRLRVTRIDGESCTADETGDIEVKGPNVFQGYWRMPEKTAQEFTSDGYFRTGDVGRMSSDGYLTIIGRSKDLIITGGYNVYPKEIESWLDELDGVLESAVIGIPHPDFGEAVIAVLVMQPGATLDESTVIAAMKQKIANFKVPKRVHFVNALPRNTMGKVQKNVLRDRFKKENSPEDGGA